MVIKGFIATILSVYNVLRPVNITELKVDPGGLVPSTVDKYSSPGDQSKPLLTDSAACLPVDGNGKSVAVGFLDPLNVDITLTGEKRIFARNDSGQIICEIYLEKDGSIQIKNALGFINIPITGIIELNGNTDFAVGFTNLLLGFNQLLADHNLLVGLYNTHQHVVNPTTFIAEPPVTPAIPSIADISGSKIDRVKV